MRSIFLWRGYWKGMTHFTRLFSSRLLVFREYNGNNKYSQQNDKAENFSLRQRVPYTMLCCRINDQVTLVGSIQWSVSTRRDSIYGSFNHTTHILIWCTFHDYAPSCTVILLLLNNTHNTLTWKVLNLYSWVHCALCYFFLPTRKVKPLHIYSLSARWLFCDQISHDATWGYL